MGVGSSTPGSGVRVRVAETFILQTSEENVMPCEADRLLSYISIILNRARAYENEGGRVMSR